MLKNSRNTRMELNVHERARIKSRLLTIFSSRVLGSRVVFSSGDTTHSLSVPKDRWHFRA